MKSGGSKSTSTRTVVMPPWLDAQNKDLVNRAVELSYSPYQAFEGQRVAEFTPDQLAAFQGTRDMQGRFQGLFDQGAQGVEQLFARSQGPTATDIQQNMNPFLENVLNITKRNAAEDTQKGLQSLARDRALANAFGGSRFALQEAQMQNDAAQRMSDIDYSGRFDAFNQALNQYNRNTDVLSNAINQGINVGTSGQQYDINDLNALIATGSTQQNLDQLKLDTKYGDFLEERAYPYEQANFLSSILQPYSQMYAGEQQTTRSKSGGSGLGKALGALGTVASFIPGGQAIGMGLSAAGGLASGNPVSALGSLFGSGLGRLAGNLGSQGLANVLAPAGQTWSNQVGYVATPIPGVKPVMRKDGGPIKGYASGGVVKKDPKDMTDAEYAQYRQRMAQENQARINGVAMPLPPEVRPNAEYDAYLEGLLSQDVPVIPNLPSEAPRYQANDSRVARGMKIIADGPVGDAVSGVASALSGAVSGGGQALKSGYDYLFSSPESAASTGSLEDAKAKASDLMRNRQSSVAPLEGELMVGEVNQPVPAQDVMATPDYAMSESDINRLMGLDPRISQLSDRYIEAQLKRAEEEPKSKNIKEFDIFGYKAQVNMPLLKAGLAMMGSDGDFFDQLAAGGSAFAGEVSKNEEELAKAEEDRLNALGSARDTAIDLATKSDYLKTAALNRQAIIEKLKRGGKDAITPQDEIKLLLDLARMNKVNTEVDLLKRGKILPQLGMQDGQ